MEAELCGTSYSAFSCHVWPWKKVWIVQPLSRKSDTNKRTKKEKEEKKKKTETKVNEHQQQHQKTKRTKKKTQTKFNEQQQQQHQKKKKRNTRTWIEGPSVFPFTSFFFSFFQISPSPLPTCSKWRVWKKKKKKKKKNVFEKKKKIRIYKFK